MKLRRYSNRKLPGGANSFWQSAANRRGFLSFVSQQLPLPSLPEPLRLYSLTVEQLVAAGGRGLLHPYDGALPLAIMTEYPDQAWEPWRFVKTPQKWWETVAKSFAAQSDWATVVGGLYLDWLMEQTGASTYDQLKQADLGKRLHWQLAYFGGLEELIARTSSWHNASREGKVDKVGGKDGLLPWSETVVDPLLWKDLAYQRKYFDFIRAQIGGLMDSLYTLTRTTVAQTGGESLITLYGQSVPLAVMGAYPDHEFEIWKFPKSPAKEWRKLASKFAQNDPQAIKLIRQYIEDLGKKHRVSSLEDWYAVPAKQIDPRTRLHLDWLGRLPKVLSKVYPNHKWEIPLFSLRINGPMAQSQMTKHVDRLIPPR